MSHSTKPTDAAKTGLHWFQRVFMPASRRVEKPVVISQGCGLKYVSFVAKRID